MHSKILYKPLGLLTLFLTSLVSVYGQKPAVWSASDIYQGLCKLNTHGSVLYIAAHPDDENTRLISYMANELHLRTGYLSLTRGDGGQNLIGAEQGVELGLIRTQELLAARRIDGGEQFFTRAYDFGYSKTPEETLRIWNHDSILSDMVWIIRHFRPDIIITRFPTDGTGGHGHHTSSGILAEEAFAAAADPQKYKWQLNYTTVWKTRRILNNSINRFRDPNANMSGFLKVNVGVFNPVLGKSSGELAAESRSMHKSQGFGSARQRGEILEYFKPLAGDTQNLSDPFQGLDITWKNIPGASTWAGLTDKAVKSFDFVNPDKSLPLLLKIRKAMEPAFRQGLYRDKQILLDQLITAVCGIVVDVTASDHKVPLGGKIRVSVTAVNRSGASVQLTGIHFPETLKGQTGPADTSVTVSLAKGKTEVISTWVNPLSSAREILSQPYWLNTMPNGIFTVSDPKKIGIPEILSNITCSVTLNVSGTLLTLDLPLQYRWVDPEKGELYRPLVLVPPVNMEPELSTILLNAGETKEIKVNLNTGLSSVTASITALVDSGLLVEPSGPVTVSLSAAESKQLVFTVSSNGKTDMSRVRFRAEVNGTGYFSSVSEISYDHIPPQTWFPDAALKVVIPGMQAVSGRIGYIPGAGDEVPEALKQMGYTVDMLNETMLSGDLSGYKAIVTGVRAYNTNTALANLKPVLMKYVREGGNLLIQYNTNSGVGPLKTSIGPYPFKLTRDRVTDENSPVTFALPEHPILNRPNRITTADFDHWIQERGIYFAGEIDTAYRCPLSFQDPGEKPLSGGLIIADHGKGHFIYTGLAFFRQLPAGVPGAYRLFSNLIELK